MAPDNLHEYSESADSGPMVSLRPAEKIIELSNLLSENGMSEREAEFYAADILDRDTFGEQKNVSDVGRFLDLDRSTVTSHYSNANQRVERATALHYMVKETRPKRIIGRTKVSSHRDDIDSVRVTVARNYTYEKETPAREDEEWVLFISKYESTGWNEVEYQGEDVRRVTGRRRVLDELNRILKEYKSNSNPVRVVGEMMYALDIPNGSLNPNHEYEVRMELVNPLCAAESPPGDHDTPPIVFANHSSVVKRFGDE